jgi:hypothetical protein
LIIKSLPLLVVVAVVGLVGLLASSNPVFAQSIISPWWRWIRSRTGLLSARMLRMVNIPSPVS